MKAYHTCEHSSFKEDSFPKMIPTCREYKIEIIRLVREIHNQLITNGARSDNNSAVEMDCN